MFYNFAHKNVIFQLLARMSQITVTYQNVPGSALNITFLQINEK